MRTLTIMLALPAAVLLCGAAPTLAADLVFVSAHVTFPTANPGGADEGTCFIANNTQTNVRVRLDVRVIYSDGTVQRMRGIQDPGVLPPDGAYELNVFFVVPPDASLGTAQFVCDVNAHADGMREHEVQTASFEVVP